MKKQLAFVVAMVLAGFGFSGCKTTPANGANDSDSVAADSLDSLAADQWDTLVVKNMNCAQEEKSPSLACKFNVDWPTGDDAFSLGVRQFIADQLLKVYLPNMNSSCEGGRKQYPAYKGDINDIKKELKYYAKGTIDYLHDEWVSDTAYGPDDIELSFEVRMFKVSENKNYVTYCTNTYCFLGGAHPSSSGDYTMISKFTNKQVKQTVKSSCLKAMQPLLRKGLVSYMKECGETGVTEKNIFNYLIIDGKTIPLPATPPLLREDGVVFCYDQYEIASYAMGMPGFVLSYKEMKPYLTKEALQLVGMEE